MTDDVTIGAPKADADGSHSDEDIALEMDRDEATVSVHVHSADLQDWREIRLAPGEAMEITDEHGNPVAYVDVDAEETS